MKPLLSVLGVFWLCGQAQAITWEYGTSGDSQGWSASMNSGTTPLPYEVADGVWRIPLPEYDPARRLPLVELTSPIIGRSSELYDHLRLRLRLVGSQPATGTLALYWRNSVNESELVPGAVPDNTAPYDALDFYTGASALYTTDWQEFTIGDLREEEHSFQREAGGPWLKGKTVWEGELLDLRLELWLETKVAIAVSSLEVDWIQLTGPEEQLQGEGPPPGYEAPVAGGALFLQATFCPLRNGIGMDAGPLSVAAALGDLNGDHSLDLVGAYEYPAGLTMASGWLAALNDGEGRFLVSRTEPDPPSTTKYTWIPFLQGADLDGDGLADLVLNQATSDLRVWRNAGKDGFVLVREFPNTMGIGLGDADGDGTVDLWTEPRSYDSATVWLNDGRGHFERSLSMGTDLFAQGFGPMGLLQDIPEGAKGLLFVPGSTEKLGEGCWVVRLTSAGEEIREHLATSLNPWLIRYVGDLDQDGDVDMVVGRQGNPMRVRWVEGLDYLVNRGDGTFATATWSQDIRLTASVQFCDLNGDGRLDMVCVDAARSGGAVVVALGQKDRLPVLEGRYPLTGAGGAVLPGDVDGDGDVDLVVLDPAAAQGGGVHVLLNQLAERRNTAVTEEQEAQPVRFRLGRSYPNPFNPQTWIPLEVPGGDQPVQLRVYNVLGQPVRTLVDGRLGAGPHLVPWDGRDEQGQEVSSGLYLYRLWLGSQQATGKMVKSE